MRKPKELKCKTSLSGYSLASIFEDCYAEQFADPGDIQVDRGVVLYDDFHIFEGLSYKRQSEDAEKIGNFLLKYSKWIKTRKRSEDPNDG